MIGSKGKTQRFGRRIGHVLLLGLFLWAATFGAVVIGAALLSRPAALPAPADAILCLGAGVTGGEPRQPDAASARRAEACTALQAEGLAPVVIFTGAGPGGHSTADAMADHSISLGLPTDAALRETGARSTIQNAAYSRALLPEGARRVILVSDAFHLPRAWAIFRLAGYPEIALHAAPGIGTTGQERSARGWMLRESLAIWWTAARGLAYVTAGAVGVDRDTRIGWFN